MNKEYSLEENASHGTKEYPIEALSFQVEDGSVGPNGFSVERHWHHGIEMIKIEKGAYRIEVNLDTIYLEEGDICFISSGELHKLEGINKNTKHKVIIFKPEMLSFSYEDSYQLEVIQPFLSGEKIFPQVIGKKDTGYHQIMHLYNQMFELIGKKTETGWYIKSKIQLLLLLEVMKEHQLFREKSSVIDASKKEKINRYKNLVRYIEANYQRKITLQELAEQVNCNAQYLCHAFQEIADTSPVQYIIDYRIECAKSMLANTNKTILEISMDCGFDNVSYFIRQFKKRTGVTPKQYRRL